MTSLYRDFKTVAELDGEYAIHLSVDDFDGYVESYRQRSSLARKRLHTRAALAYGPTLSETFDFFPADQPNAPVAIFIHGGYWYQSDRDEWSFIAEGLHEAGFAVVVENYALCPSVSMTEIVRQHRALLAHVHRNAADLSVDPSNIVVVGHSAGGHGVAALLQTDWREYGLPREVISLAVGISGVYDLRPLPYTFVGPHLQLSRSEAIELSPILGEAQSDTPILVAVGTLETAEFIRQSRDFAQTWRRNGANVELLELPRNHYDIVDELGAGGVLLNRIVATVNS